MIKTYWRIALPNGWLSKDRKTFTLDPTEACRFDTLSEANLVSKDMWGCPEPVQRYAGDDDGKETETL